MLKKVSLKVVSTVAALAMVCSVGVNVGTANAAAKKVTLKFFTNLPDRKSGQGKLEQTLINNYMKENPNVKIEVEALQDEPYKQKFKAYAASNELSDIFSIWGMPSFFGPVMKNHYALELNKNDYKNYDFVSGSLDGFSMDGKLYGLPRNTDATVLYYNKALFAKYKLKLPTTVNDLIADAKVFNKKGIATISMDGKDKWPLALLFHDLVVKEGGDQKLLNKALTKKTSFAKNPVLLKAAKDVELLASSKVFQDSYLSADYGTAKNLFAQGKAATYYMGTWEMGMAKDTQLPASFRKNLGVMRFPTIKGGKGKVTDMTAWNGGGYAISARSKNKEQAKKFLNYMMKPTNWAKIGWQAGINVPGQKFAKFMTGKEDELSKNIASFLDSSTSISGTGWDDAVTAEFKTISEDSSQELAAGMLKPQSFLDQIQSALK